MDKLKAGIFDGSQIRELMKDPMFYKAELLTWLSLKLVKTNFLRNYRSAEYEKEIKKLLKSFRQLGVWMPVKVHFLWSHKDYFPKYYGYLSEEQGECFHQDIHIMEERYQGRWDVNVLADYSWYLKRDAVAVEHRRESLKRPFIHK